MARVKLNELNDFLHRDIHDPKKEAGSLQNIAFGAINSLPQAALGVASLGEGLVRAGIGAVDAAFDENKTLEEGLFEGVLENKSLQLANKADDFMRDVFGVNADEDLSPTEQRQQMFGEFLPILVTKGAHGLVKVGNVLAKKAAKKAYTKAIQKGLTKAARKKAIKNSIVRTDLATNFVIPGIQITKNASKPRQLVEFGLQAGVPLTKNEISRATNKQEGIFGDYRENTEDIYLIKDKRKTKNKEYIDELNPEDYAKIELETNKDENNILENTATAIGIGLAALFAPKMLAKGYKVLPQGVKENAFTKFIQKQFKKSTNNKTFLEEALPETTLTDINATDRFAFRNVAHDMGLIDEETKIDLARSISQRTDSAFNTGKIKHIDGVDIDFGVSPRQTKIMMEQLQLENPKAYNNLEQFIELNSKIQDDIHRINLKNSTEFGTDDYLKYLKENRMMHSVPDLMDNLKNLKTYNNILQQNPVTKQIVSNINKISEGLLRFMEKSGAYNREVIEYLRKNRTINNLMLYKPRKTPKTDKTFADNIHDLLFTREPVDNFSDVFNKVRGSDDVIDTAENYLDVMERHIKDVVSGVLDNDIRYKTLSNLEKSTIKNVKNNYATKMAKINANEPVNFDFNKDLHAVHLGYIDLTTKDLKKVVNSKSFSELLNIADNNKTIDELNKLYAQKIAKFSPSINNMDENLLSVVHDGKKHYYYVPKIIKDAFDVDTKMPSILYEMNNKFKNAIQRTITGTLANPTFFLRGYKYSLDEAATMMSTIAKEVGIKDPSVVSLALEHSPAFKQAYSFQKANQIADDWAREFVKTGGKFDTPEAKKLADLTQEKIRANINKNLLTELNLEGMNIDKPINITQTGKFYNLTDTKPSKIIRMFGVGEKFLNNAKRKYSFYKMITDSVRSTPTIGMINKLGKTSGSIIDGIIKDYTKIGKLTEAVNKYTAHTGAFGTGKGITGTLAKISKEQIPFGDIMQQSVASKLRSLNVMQNGKELLNAWIDPNIRYVDFFKKLSSSLSDTAKNKFVQSSFKTVAIPATIAYFWNHETQENRDAYYSLSNYDKAKGLVLVNMLGKGNHITIPMDQELGILHNMYNMLLDTTFNSSEQQEVDPNFSNVTPLQHGLARSLQIDLPPALRAGVATLGYKVDPSAMFTENKYLSELKNYTNNDMSKSAYEQGFLNAETIEFMNAVSGRWGQLLANLIETTNKENVNIGESLLDTGKQYISGGKLWTNKATTFNDTSKAVYNYLNRLDVISQIQNKNPKQIEIYETVKLYNKNRILPIHEKIKELRKDLRKLKTTSKLNDGTVLSLGKVDEATNTINKKLQELYSLEYKEIQNLDNYIEQLYGKDINFNNFMETFAQ